MSASKIPKKFRAAKRLEVIYKLGDEFNAYKGNHNGKHKHIQFDDGDQLKYTNIKKNTGRKKYSDQKFDHVLVVGHHRYPVRILTDESTSINNHTAAEILYKMYSERMNVNNAAKILSSMSKSRKSIKSIKSRKSRKSGGGIRKRKKTMRKK